MEHIFHIYMFHIYYLITISQESLGFSIFNSMLSTEKLNNLVSVFNSMLSTEKLNNLVSVIQLVKGKLTLVYARSTFVHNMCLCPFLYSCL